MRVQIQNIRMNSSPFPATTLLHIIAKLSHFPSGSKDSEKNRYQ